MLQHVLLKQLVWNIRIHFSVSQILSEVTYSYLTRTKPVIML